MASAWIRRVELPSGSMRYRVVWRAGGRESARRYGGSFPTMREARARRDAIAGELAARRMPDLRSLELTSPPAPTLRMVAERWRESRVDVAESTRVLHRVALGRVLPTLGKRPVDKITAADVAELVASMALRYKRETISKSITALAQVLDFAGVSPNPARDKAHVRLPREERREPQPPTGEHIEAVCHLLPRRYRLPLLVLDATGMRLGELEQLVWGDVDEQRGRWRVSAAVSKTRRARWVSVPPVLFEAVTALVPREDRAPARPVFQGFGGDRFRTAITRACTAAGVPTFSPHALRHRRISLEHLRGVPWARIGESVGQRNLAVTANTYSHVLVDESELDYSTILVGS